MAEGMAYGRTWDYDRSEIVADGIVHGVGLALAVAGTALLLAVRPLPTTRGAEAALVVYCAALLTTLSVSAAYNLWPVSHVKWRLRRLDHGTIFLLIAGTYTPFLVRIGEPATDGLLVAIWVAGGVGLIVKVLDFGRREWLATVAYLVVGWSGMLVIGPIAGHTPGFSLLLIVAGGIVYSAGVVFHHWRGLRFQNAIWHAFVLGGASCHFVAVAATA